LTEDPSYAAGGGVNADIDSPVSRVIDGDEGGRVNDGVLE
jgi:hypothetical protein